MKKQDSTAILRAEIKHYLDRKNNRYIMVPFKFTHDDKGNVKKVNAHPVRQRITAWLVGGKVRTATGDIFQAKRVDGKVDHKHTQYLAVA